VYGICAYETDVAGRSDLRGLWPDLPGRAETKVTWHLLGRHGRPSPKGEAKTSPCY
jgi:hypothetical protein